MEQQTSRSWVLDWTELVWQLLALSSHLQEIADSHWFNEEVTDEDKEVCEWITKTNTMLRRKLMDKIFESWYGDHKYRCAVKHSVFCYELANELQQTDTDDETFKLIQRLCSQSMYMILSKFLWNELVLCWRCLNDSLSQPL